MLSSSLTIFFPGLFIAYFLASSNEEKDTALFVEVLIPLTLSSSSHKLSTTILLDLVHPQAPQDPHIVHPHLEHNKSIELSTFVLQFQHPLTLCFSSLTATSGTVSLWLFKKALCLSFIIEK